MSDVIGIEFASQATGVLQVHDQSACGGEACCIHNPSEHPLNTRPLVWDGRRYRMFRKCMHGKLHPDPDHLAYVARVERGHARTVSVAGPVETPLMADQRDHECDGCCDSG